MFKLFFSALFVVASLSAPAKGSPDPVEGPHALKLNREFPRLAAIDYSGKLGEPGVAERLARFDLVILGAAEPVPKLTNEIKRQRPDVLIGLYTVLNEARRTTHTALARERLKKIDDENWWLKDTKGTQLRWTAEFGTWEVNVSEWARPDAEGKRYPEWAAEFWYRHLFKGATDIDIWFFDNVFLKQRIKSADWKGIGQDQSGDDPEIKAAFRRAQRLEVDYARKLSPSLVMMGNADNDLGAPEYKEMLDGAQIECIIGQKWSIETRLGWSAMMKYYAQVSANIRNPHALMFGTCLNDFGNYKEVRYAFASALMGNGFFQIADQSATYREQPWFDEFSVRLGKAVDGPFPLPEVNGGYKRKFERGIVLVNPTAQAVEFDLGKGYRRFLGKQAPEINTGMPVSSVITIPPRDGIVLVVQ
ncbi:putative glycoside hydrolase [Methyloversatilis sp.]|uniref:putative glycoside hydrolase n=1 Tax=Methyloversatilis sp. TaxID=2569862 RepID=UPI002736EA5F|nr:putative glycoside hydrolase [Methyloversatilis sp.]MDP3455946.1 putative glycoside hydrolase [Methyloversatilis sp.]